MAAPNSPEITVSVAAASNCHCLFSLLQCWRQKRWTPPSLRPAASLLPEEEQKTPLLAELLLSTREDASHCSVHCKPPDGERHKIGKEEGERLLGRKRKIRRYREEMEGNGEIW
nr:hypothetical protein Itr_chr03CG02850 [Ipomoea trifida]GLL37082.1 hypothetical protein Itr_chr10CG08200 [Ipomoea trifida]